jgi:hypothetical protein
MKIFFLSKVFGDRIVLSENEVAKDKFKKLVFINHT